VDSPGGSVYGIMELADEVWRGHADASRFSRSRTASPPVAPIGSPPVQGSSTSPLAAKSAVLASRTCTSTRQRRSTRRASA
jgi:hypothetical protein